MVPWGGRAIKLEVVDIFHVSRDLVIGGVDESLVKVDKEYKLPIRHKPAQVFTSKRGCFTFAHLCCLGHATLGNPTYAGNIKSTIKSYPQFWDGMDHSNPSTTHCGPSVFLAQICSALCTHVLHHSGVRTSGGKSNDSLFRGKDVSHLQN